MVGSWGFRNCFDVDSVVVALAEAVRLLYIVMLLVIHPEFAANEAEGRDFGWIGVWGERT